MEVESGLFGITRFDPVENVKPAEDEPGLSAKEKLLKKARDRAAKRKLRDTAPAENKSDDKLIVSEKENEKVSNDDQGMVMEEPEVEPEPKKEHHIIFR